MPIRQGGILTSRASTWPRDHFCRSTMAPRASWPTTWNEFLPISMPITAIALSNFWDMACSLSLAPLPSILSLVGQEHGRTIPLTDLGAHRNVQGPEEQNRVDAKGKTPRGPCRDEFKRLSRLNENIGRSDQEIWEMVS